MPVDDEVADSVCLDIALGEKKHRITLYPNSVPDSVAEDFAKEHGLDLKLQKKL